MEYNKLIDNTLLKADATKEQIIALCEESKKYDFKSVCINPDFISLAKENLKGSDVLICTVIGFPLGSMTTKAKAFEAKDAIEEGADEIDMVINISALKDKNYEYVLNDIKAVREATKGCELCVEAKVDFVKTSTGFSLWGAKVEDVKLMRETVGPEMGVKAAGGVRTHEEMLEMVKNGATRIGTSSGAKLMK